MIPFHYAPMFPLPAERANWRKLDCDGVSRATGPFGPVVRIEPALLRQLAREAFSDLSFFLSRRHLQAIADVLDDAAASENERFVAQALLRNAVVAAEGLLPLCQDTGTAMILGRKGERTVTGADDARELARGVRDAWLKRNLRYSQMIPLGMLDEENSGTNLPAHIELQADRGPAYRFLFMAKGAGSANKTRLFMETKALLNSERSLTDFLRERIRDIGVAACPPYHLAIAIGGLAPETTIKAAKLASAGALDGLPLAPSPAGHAYRDTDWENRTLTLCRETELGMQFGGRHFAFETRVVRLPRHAGSVPVAIAVSCNAHRQILGKITARGAFLEKLERNPARFLARHENLVFPSVPRICLDQTMDRIVADLSRCPAGTRVELDGTLIVARDIAHARLNSMMNAGKKLPAWFFEHPVYYAGPAKTPPGRPTGSFGPTTAQRMDRYAPDFMRLGASRVMLAKGNRDEAVRKACRTWRGFYLATIGGAAALVADRNIVSSEVVDFADLGMEAVRKIRVRNLPAFVVFDSRGRSLY